MKHAGIGKKKRIQNFVREYLESVRGKINSTDKNPYSGGKIYWATVDSFSFLGGGRS